jgi:hypothetical protein
MTNLLHGNESLHSGQKEKSAICDRAEYNSSGLFLNIEPDSISVRHKYGDIIAEWQLQELAERFLQKIPALLFVSAFSEFRGDIEWFKFDRLQLLSGTSSDIIRNQIYAGNIIVDLRLHEKITSARNHGTGFRVHEDKLPLLFLGLTQDAFQRLAI